MTGPILLPALRGTFGDWAYYTCLMEMSTLAARVDYAKEVHNNEGLSDMIQRELEEGRAPAIKSYLLTNDERFFNSLVIAVYGGEPSWHEFGRITPKKDDPTLADIPDYAKHSIGFLKLTGKEKLFALDGQHRLAGIKAALKENQKLRTDQVSTIFVAHKKTKAGLRRTRRLFTTLNKTARPVSKSAVIALDEADVMAITVRRLVEEDERFSGDRIAFKHTNNLTGADTAALTTIGNLYDVLERLFLGELKGPARGEAKEQLKFFRPTDPDLDAYFVKAKEFFDRLGEAFPELGAFYEADDTEEVIEKHRGTFGGSMLFRPIGLIAMTEVVIKLINSRGEDAAFEAVAKLPTDLNRSPYANVLWDTVRCRVIAGGPLARRLMLHMLGETPQKDISKLREDYARALDRPGEPVRLPGRV
ncbi:hypothetical protein ASF59_00090 [Methylobacterium sp. Leaf121]|nr:hypothetical protein ASF59_00090 [Methylobacterium sp. Leaf121]